MKPPVNNRSCTNLTGLAGRLICWK